MKTITFENQFNREKFTCTDPKSVQIIDGVEFLPVSRVGTNRIVLVRKDLLKRVDEKKK